jgi:hypothetical protein
MFRYDLLDMKKRQHGASPCHLWQKHSDVGGQFGGLQILEVLKL